MSIFNCTGFESNLISAAHEVNNSGGTVAIISSGALTGTYSLQCNPATTAVGWAEQGKLSASTGQQQGPGTGTSPFNHGFKFKPVTLPAANSEEFAVCMTGAGVLIAALRVTSAGKVQLFNSDGTTQIGSDSSITLSAGTSYYVEWWIANGTAGSCVGLVRINGTQEISVTTGTFTTAAADLDVFRVGKVTNRNGQSVDFIFDDHYIGDGVFVCAATSVAAEWPQIARLAPNAAGFYTAFTAGTGASDFNEVDEIAPDGNTTYVQSVAANDAQTFGVESCASKGVSGTIHAVLGMSRTIRSAVGDGRRPRMRSNTTDVDTSGTLAGSTYQTQSIIRDTDPATSAAWTTSGVDGVEFGSIDLGSTGRNRMSWVSVMVLFSPAAVGGFNAAWNVAANSVIQPGAVAV